MFPLRLAFLAASVAFALPTMAVAQPMASHADHANHADHTAAPSASAEMADGEVRKVDPAGRRLTLRHGPLPHLDMPHGMTMVFRVRDDAMLEGLQPGDKVRFMAEKIEGRLTVTGLEAVR